MIFTSLKQDGENEHHGLNGRTFKNSSNRIFNNSVHQEPFKTLINCPVLAIQSGSG